MKPTTTKLDQAAMCFVAVRQNLLQGAALLTEISEQNLWSGSHSSFGAYVESECQISQSFAAKLVKVYKYYVVEKQVPERQIEAIDAEKLYMAIALPGAVDQQIIRAQTWTRAEIRAELASDENGDCIHEKTVNICVRCHARI